MSTRELELTIDSLAAGGDGVGRDSDGRVTFVPRSAPGDRLRVRLVEEKARMARGEIVAVLEPSPVRVAPGCEAFEPGRCGGCQWLHVATAAQREAKQALVANALRRCLADGMELEPLVTPAPALGWRRRARLHWIRRHRGRGVVLGLFRARSREVVDIGHCPQLEPGLQQALDVVRAQLAPGLRGRGELSLLVGAHGQVHVAVRGEADGRAAANVVGKGPIVGISVGRRSWGQAALELEPDLRGRADGFAQASRAGNAALLDAVDAYTTPRAEARILELYAGTGNLTRVLRQGARQIVAVDVATPNEPTSAAGAPVSWRKGDVADIVATLAELDQRFDLAVLDPPRTGAADALAGLLALRPGRVVYVSCDPATLARDADRLRASGYRAVRARGIDTMPQTAHVEVVLGLALAKT